MYYKKLVPCMLALSVICSDFSTVYAAEQQETKLEENFQENMAALEEASVTDTNAVQTDNDSTKDEEKTDTGKGELQENTEENESETYTDDTEYTEDIKHAEFDYQESEQPTEAFIPEEAQAEEQTEASASQKRTGWYTDKKGRRYYYVKHKPLTGIQKVNKKWYYFSKKGRLVTNRKGWVTVQNHTYYRKKNGRLVSNKIITVKKKRYLMLPDATRAKAGAHKYNGIYHYTNKKGQIRTGWIKHTNGKWYYFNPDGKRASNAIIKKGKKRWYCNEYGVMQKNKIITIDGYSYYFNKSGLMQTGLVHYKGAYYYFRKNAGNGKPKGAMGKSAWLNSKGYLFYFGKNGKRAFGERKIDGKYYYFRPKRSGGAPAGSAYSGWMTTSEGTCYYNPKKNCSKSINTMVRINGYRYHFNAKGFRSTGWFTYNSRKFYAKANGKLACGWLKKSGKTYYFSKKYGVMQTGWKTIDGKKYYFSSSGVMQTSKWIDKTHYVGSDGAWIEGYVTPSPTISGNFRWPLSSSYSEIISYFGHRDSPGGIGSTNHQGIDIPAPKWTPIYAVDGGTVVVKLKASQSGGFGKYIQINNGGGLISEYAHMCSFADGIEVGKKVHKGQVIGYVGMTGTATGFHLHFGVLKNGVRVDPLNYVSPPR